MLALGVTEYTAYVKLAVPTARWPSVLITTTSTFLAAAMAGVTTVMLRPSTTVTPVAATPSNVTVAPGANPVP